MTFRITPLNTLAPHTIVEDLGLVYANGSKVDRLVEELQADAEKLGANAVVRLRFVFEGRGMAYGAAVRVE